MPVGPLGSRVSSMDEPSSPPPADVGFDVTELAAPDVLLEALTEQLAAWMPLQRWYAHKGTGAPAVRIRGWAPLRVAADHLVLMAVVGASAGEGEALYQVPLVLRRPQQSPDRTQESPHRPRESPHRTQESPHRPRGRAVQSQGGAGQSVASPDPPEEGAEIGVIAVPGGPLRAEDATRSPVGRAALLDLLVSGGGALGPQLRLSARSSHAPAAPAPSGEVNSRLPSGEEDSRLLPGGADSQLLTGEQSNTSMIFGMHPEAGRARPVIIKLFRLLQDGENPDVVLQSALGQAGSTRVPPPLGSVRLALASLRTHAMFAQEFLPGMEDAWRTALEQARAGTDFSAPAAALGQVLAEVHRDLAVALGTRPTDRARADAMVAQMRERLDRVAGELPEVGTHRAQLAQLLSAAGTVSWPPMQRVHGDLHLGQVLSTPDRGWVLLDFEGEPLRPLAQRSLPDCPLRDVAGMLRSLDYVAGAVAHEHGLDASAWAFRARQAFLDGYTHEAGPGTDPAAQRILIAAFEADKAVYEALYEARNRPDWLPIPLSALARISAAAAAAGSAG